VDSVNFVVGDVITPGVANAYRITDATSGSPTAGVGDQLTITLVDVGGNTITSFSGNKNLTFSGLSTAGDGTNPTITDKNGTAQNLGTAATITFAGGVANGVSSAAGGVLTAYKAETQTLNVQDDASMPLSSTSTGGAGVSLTIANVAPVGGMHYLGATVNKDLVVSVSTLANLDYDANHDTLTITAVGTTTASGTSVALTGAGTTITYRPGTYVGADQFTYTISDGQGGTATSTAKVTVGLGQVTSLFIYISTPVNHAVNLRGYGIPLHTYSVQRSSSSDFSSYATLGAVQAAANGIILYMDNAAPDSQAFYRFAVPQ
jgi:hypothetical protein